MSSALLCGVFILSEWLCNGHFMTYHYRFYVPTIELSFPVKGDCKGNYELAARWILQICISNVKRYILGLIKVCINLYQIAHFRDVHVQIIRRVITHRTICFYSQNTLFLKIGVNQSILFIYFSTFLFKDHLYSKEYTTKSSKNEFHGV